MILIHMSINAEKVMKIGPVRAEIFG